MNTIPSVLLEYINGLETHDVPKIAMTVADNLRFITPSAVVDKERFLSFLRALYGAFPDWAYDHDEPELHNDVIAVKSRQGGTHTGAFILPDIPAIAATGKSVKIPEQFFHYRVGDDQIVEIRPYPIPGGAPHGIFEQLGVEWPARR